MVTPSMMEVLREQRLGFVATVNVDGTPNLSPKGIGVGGPPPSVDELPVVFWPGTGDTPSGLTLLPGLASGRPASRGTAVSGKPWA